MMNIKVLSLISLIGVFFVVDGAAQGRKINRVEFDKAVDAAFEASGKKNRREVTSSGTFEGNKSVQTSIVLEEFMPPGRSRWRSTDDISGNKSSTEWIVIDGKRYSKSASGVWFVDRPLPEVKTIKATDEENAADDKRTTFTRRISKHIGESVTIYQSVYTAPADVMTGTSTFTIYIGKDGLIQRREQNTVELGKGNYKKEVTTYEYNPKGLKIETPIK